jgi:tetratricopeptide (TPR) repeat protein
VELTMLRRIGRIGVARAVQASLVLSATLTLACTTGVDQARRHAARGDEYYAADRFEAAVIEYRNAVKKQPRWADAYIKLGDAYTALDKAEEAYRAYASANELAPGNTRCYLGMGRLLHDAGMYNEARMRAELVLDRDPRNIDALLLYGRTLVRQSRFNEAIGAFNTALALDKRPAAYAGLAQAKLGAGDAAGAERVYRAGVDENPRSVEAGVTLGQFLIGSGRVDEGEKQLLNAVRMNPQDELANRAIASLYATTGRRGLAEPYLKAAAVRPRQKFRSTLALADFYIMERRFAEAADVLQPAAREPATATAAKVRLAEIEYETAPENAHRALDRVLKKTPTGEGWALKARFLNRERKQDGALEAARTAIDLDRRIALAHYIAGTIELERKNYDEAEHAFREVLQLNRMTSEATVQLARTRLAAGHPADAISLAESAGPNPEARLTLARALIADGQIDRARNELRRLQSDNTKSPEPSVLLGSLDLERGDIPAARVQANQALMLAPESVDALLLAARLALAADDQAAAETYLSQVVARDPASFDGHTLLSQIYASRRDFDRARETLEALAAVDPQSAEARTAVGLVLQAAGRDADARRWYEQAIALQPDEPIAAHKLARLYASDGSNPDAAVSLGQIAATRLPDEAEVHDTLGWAYYRAGRLRLAMPEIERAIALDPREPEFRRHLDEVRRARAEEAAAEKPR